MDMHAAEAQESCGKSDISFTVIKTGNVVKGQPEYQVEFETRCPCPIKDVHVWCGGVENSAETLDPTKVEVVEGMCLLKQPIVKGSPLFFTYSSEVPVNFRVFRATVVCHA